MSGREQLRIWLIGLVMAGILLYLLRGVLLPFVAGMAVAYFLDPVADRLEKWGLSRTLATSLIVFGFLVVLLLVILAIVPAMQGQLVDFLRKLPDYIIRLRDTALPVLNGVIERISPDGMIAKIEPSDVSERLAGFIEDSVAWLGSLLKQVWSGGLALVNLVSLLVITPVVTFYLLRDWDHLVAKVDHWLPRQHRDTIREQLSAINQVLAGFARGQATMCLVLAIYYATALTVIGLDFGLVIGTVTGLISFVPFVGAITGFVLAGGVAAIQYWPDDLVRIGIVLVVYVVGQFLEGNILTPRLVGDKVGLHPVWVIFGMLAGGTLFGFVGILIAVPLFATLGVLARFSLARYLDSRLYHGPGDDGAPS